MPPRLAQKLPGSWQGLSGIPAPPGITMSITSRENTDPGDLPPHPHWRWGAYPLRWLVGGCWSLCRSPLSALCYGGIFFAVAWVWRQLFRGGGIADLGLAITLTGVTLLLAPRLTAGLMDLSLTRPNPRCASAASRAQERGAALLGVGGLLVLLLVFALHAALLGFALLFSGEVPALDRLLPALLRWQNAPLVLALILILVSTALGMQAVAVIPTFALREQDTDLVGAVRASARLTRRNWRPLACWALTSQVLLFVGGGILPAALIVLAPLIAHGSWWAFRELAGCLPASYLSRQGGGTGL